MSDGFTPAQVGSAPPPVPASDKAPALDPLHEIVLMGEEIAQMVAQVAAMIPSLGPLVNSANRLKVQVARIRELISPTPPEGPQPDHS